MSSEMAFLDELCQDCLLQDRRETVNHSTRAPERPNQLLRQDQEADAKRGEQRLTERSCVDHAVGASQTLHRGLRNSRVTIFTVEIVLDDPRIVALRPLDPSLPAF